MSGMVEARENMEHLLLQADDWEEQQRFYLEVEERENRRIEKHKMFRKMRNMGVPARRAYLGARMSGMQLIRFSGPELKYWGEFLKSRTDEQFQSLKEAFGV